MGSKWPDLEFLRVYRWAGGGGCGWSWPAALMMMELSLLIIIRVVILPPFRAQPVTLEGLTRCEVQSPGALTWVGFNL